MAFSSGAGFRCLVRQRVPKELRATDHHITTSVQILHQSKSAAYRHEWRNYNDHYHDNSCITTKSQATTYRPRSSPAARVGAPATPSGHERQVESEGGFGGGRPRSDVREPEEPHRGARGRRGVCGGRGTPLWCARLHVCCYTPILSIYASFVCYS